MIEGQKYSNDHYRHVGLRLHMEKNIYYWICILHIKLAYLKYNTWEHSRCADIPENELQHDVFTVQGEKSPEEAQ